MLPCAGCLLLTPMGLFVRSGLSPPFFFVVFSLLLRSTLTNVQPDHHQRSACGPLGRRDAASGRRVPVHREGPSTSAHRENAVSADGDFSTARSVPPTGPRAALPSRPTPRPPRSTSPRCTARWGQSACTRPLLLSAVYVSEVLGLVGI